MPVRKVTIAEARQIALKVAERAEEGTHESRCNDDSGLESQIEINTVLINHCKLLSKEVQALVMSLTPAGQQEWLCNLEELCRRAGISARDGSRIETDANTQGK